jgi:Protein of unknown function (DUF4058)
MNMDDPALRFLKDAERYLLRVDEAAQTLRISRRAVEGLVERGRLHKLFFKGRPYIATYELELYKFNKQGKPMLQAESNLFNGLNPHLMSLLQTAGFGATTSAYPSFHADHITHIKDFLNDYLPPQYIALTEPSLQIQARQQDTFIKDSQVAPDVAIYKSQSTQAHAQQPSTTADLQLELQLDELESWSSVAVYAVDHTIHGTPIVRLELLSPANMSGGSYAEVYQQNRAKSLLSGTSLIEIDYLHEYASPVKGIPQYPIDKQSKAYNITVSRPQIKKVDVYLFGVNEPLPSVLIPLVGEDFIRFDFGEPYTFTWKKSRFWFYIDYSQDPLRMNSYSPKDQEIIRARMQEIQQSFG